MKKSEQKPRKYKLKLVLIDLKKSKKGIIITVIAAVVILISAVLTEILTPGIAWLFVPKAKVQNGVLPEIEDTSHINEVPKGEIRYLINNNVVFDKASQCGSFMFENPAACEYTLQFFVYEVTNDNKERLIYESPMLEPGTYLYNDKLKRTLSVGEHECIYYAKAYIDGVFQGERNGTLTVTVIS